MQNEVLESSEVIKKPEAPQGGVRRFLDKSMILKIILAILSILISFFVQNLYYKPNLGTFIDSDMDSSGNTYILSTIEKSNQYKITKLSDKGIVTFEKKLDKSSGNESFKYKHLEVDSKGNFFITQEVRNLDAIVSDQSKYPVARELVKMYDKDGNEVKQVALFDFASASMTPTSDYIKKVQIVNQKLSIICCRDNNVEVVGVNPYIDQSPEKEFSFGISLPGNDKSWVNDFSVTSNGNVVYSTKSGNIYISSQDGTTTDCKSIFPSGQENSIQFMSIDRLDNIYFTDLKTGSFYKFDTSSMTMKFLYSIDDKIKINDLTIKDLRKIRVINENDYFGTSKTFVNPYFVRFGTNNTLVPNVSYSFFPYGLIMTILGALLIIAILFIIIRIFKTGIKKTYVSVKATAMFLPIFVLVTLGMVIYSTKKSMISYTAELRQNQTIGAKIVAEKIDGDFLPKMIWSSEYGTERFVSVENSIKNAYIDLRNKVGDHSDYILVYAQGEDGKLYLVANNKYSGDSKYYKDLKFANPDMACDKLSLADTLLERDEIENIYSVFSSLKDNKAKNEFATFRDVHGDLTASFVPVENSSGSVVGMVGIFIDENSHVVSKMLEILKESSILVGIISVLVFLYLCLIVWILLKPMRILNKGIEVMINGHWKNRLPITSKDEFASISVAFNNMSDKLEEYTDNLMDLNSEYLRYVPKELLNLVGKEKITQTNVGDGKSSKVAIVYITFNIIDLDAIDDMEQNLFSNLQESYSHIFDIVENNKGIVQNFSSLGATLIFNDSKSAISSALQILESRISPSIKENMRVSVGLGSSFVGIIGNDVRRGVSMASKEMLRLIKIDSEIKRLGIRFAATEFVKGEINEDFALSLRFVGKFKDISNLSWVRIYEIISSSDNLQRNLSIQTKRVFERAVQLYIDGNFEESRNLFLEVLHKNSIDKPAISYVNMCNLRMKINNEKHELTNFINEIFEN